MENKKISYSVLIEAYEYIHDDSIEGMQMNNKTIKKIDISSKAFKSAREDFSTAEDAVMFLVYKAIAPDYE